MIPSFFFTLRHLAHSLEELEYLQRFFESLHLDHETQQALEKYFRQDESAFSLLREELREWQMMIECGDARAAQKKFASIENVVSHALRPVVKNI